MLLLRAGLLEFLVCYHVVGGAVLFRRLFPRESSWLAFIVPTLAFMALFNFLEHYIAMPNLGWLLPITLGGLLWVMIGSGTTRKGFWLPAYSTEGMWLPGLLFL